MEIEFRGKQVDNGEWVYGYYYFNGRCYWMVNNDKFVNEHQEVHPETVGQYTTLRDSKRTKEFPERQDKFDKESRKALAVAYEKAEKINYKDYDGYFLLPHSERLQEIDDVRDWISDNITEGEDVPEYLWAVEGEKHFSIDLKDVISDKCEDGYEDMYNNLSTGSSLITQAQELISQWENEQGDSLFLFSETHKKAVIIKDLVEEIRAELAAENKSGDNS